MKTCPVCARPSATVEPVVVLVRPTVITNRRYKFIEVTLAKYVCGHIVQPTEDIKTLVTRY